MGGGVVTANERLAWEAFVKYAHHLPGCRAYFVETQDCTCGARPLAKRIRKALAEV